MRNSLSISLRRSLSRSMNIERLKVYWNKVVQDPKAFIPWEHRNISEEEAVNANVCFGDFAKEYMIEELDRYKQSKGEVNYSKILSIGWGKGYDYGWLRHSIASLFHTWIVDVSDVACSWAEIVADEDLRIEREKVGYSSHLLEPKVVEVEIRSALLDPETHLGIDLRSISIWYASRVIGCLKSKVAVQDVLRNMGRSLSQEFDWDKTKRIVLLIALLDDNRDRVTLTSKLYSRHMILWNISKGAGRPVVPYRESTYRYFGQNYTAMTIVAK